jgi:hypothetical protein
MRINYYQFPDTVDTHTRRENGAAVIDGDCIEPGRLTCTGCLRCAEGWRECPHYICTGAETEIPGISVTAAKKLLRQFGGSAWTHHIDRDGGVFETTEIILTGNNSRHKYNKHL